ncbi:hypothetical protein RCS94_06650 [Orbaceae bacterium ac157xtp]
MSYKYFSYDPDDWGFELHETAEQAKARANKSIPDYLDDGWDDSVEQVCWGEIKEIATKINIEHVDEYGYSSDGHYVGVGYGYSCDYELKPVHDNNEQFMISKDELKQEIKDLCKIHMGGLPSCSEEFGQDDDTVIGSVGVLRKLYEKYVGFDENED